MISTLLKNKVLVFVALFLSVTSFVFASSGDSEHGPVMTLLWMGIILFFAMLGRFIEKAKQPSVLGELLIGVLIGNLGLLGFHFFDPIKNDVYIKFLAEIGVIFYFFKFGLNPIYLKLKKEGLRPFFFVL